MEDIQSLYYNTFGISFQWKNGEAFRSNKIQLVFRKTGLLLTKEEMMNFSSQIEFALQQAARCQCCPKNKQEKSFLLQTPHEKLSFAITVEELAKLKDLVLGTLFHLDLDNFLGNIAVGYK